MMTIGWSEITGMGCSPQSHWSSLLIRSLVVSEEVSSSKQLFFLRWIQIKNVESSQKREEPEFKC